MIKFSSIRTGDYLIANYDGSRWEGIVTEINREDKEVCVETEVQSFWFKADDLEPIPLDERQLNKMGFEKDTSSSPSVKYKKGPFRILLSNEGQFDDFEIWYREDIRHIKQPIGVHELQNHYLEMTKVELA